MICDKIYDVYLCKYANFEVFEINRAGGLVYDIHCHIIPNIDDGSGSLNDSVEMAVLAAKAGTKAMIATPHCNIPDLVDNYWSESFDKKILQLNEELSNRKIPVVIYPGQEIFYHGDVLTLLKRGRLVTLNNSEYVLIEFDFDTGEAEVFSAVQALVSQGYKPIIAHPERYGFAYENPDSIGMLKSSGAFIQVNGDSIIGRLGSKPMKVSRYMLEKQLVDIVASDAHSQYLRTPDLSEVHEFVCSCFSYDYADLIFNNNPLCVLNNKEIR